MPPDAEPVGQSFLSWMFLALGFKYAVLLPFAGLVCFLLALIVVIRGQGPMAVASLILTVHVPLLIGIFAALQGAIASYTVIAMSPLAPKPADVATGISTALVAPMVEMLLMLPGYVIAALRALIRSLQSNTKSSSSLN